MSYYWFNKQENLQKAKKKHILEKNYLQNKETIKEKQEIVIETYQKKKIKDYQKKKYQELLQYKKEALKNKQIFLPVYNIK